MTDQWPTIALGDVLIKSNNWIEIRPNERYQQVTVRLWGKGIVRRGEVSGAEIAAARQLAVCAGQFILSRIDARNGAFGLVPHALEGAVVSNDFPAFSVNAQRILPSYLEWLSKTRKFVDLCRAASEGTTNRVRLKEDEFLATEIDLPPLAEQQRIVARIEQLVAKIEEARGLRREAIDQIDTLLVSMAYRNDLDETEKRLQGWQKVQVSDIVQQVQDKRVVNPQEAYPNVGIYSFGRGLFHKPPIQGFATSASTLYRVRSGQFIYSRLFAFEGSYGLVTDEFDGCFVSNEYPTFDCDPDLVIGTFLYAYFKSPAAWQAVAAGSKGLGDRRQRVQLAQVLAYCLWLPPLDWQAKIDQTFYGLDRLRQLQAETAAELDALLPSVLDRAFNGTL